MTRHLMYSRCPPQSFLKKKDLSLDRFFFTLCEALPHPTFRILVQLFFDVAPLLFPPSYEMNSSLFFCPITLNQFARMIVTPFPLEGVYFFFPSFFVGGD